MGQLIRVLKRLLLVINWGFFGLVAVIALGGNGGLLAVIICLIIAGLLHFLISWILKPATDQ